MLVSRRGVATQRRAVCELKKSSRQLSTTQGVHRFATAHDALKESSELLELRGCVRTSAVAVDELKGRLGSAIQCPTRGESPSVVHYA